MLDMVIIFVIVVTRMLINSQAVCKMAETKLTFYKKK